MKDGRNRASSARTESNYVSVWFWMFAQLLLLLPFINLIAIPVLAFAGENRSRKNFFRALLMWLAIIIGLHLSVLLIGFTPQVIAWFKDLWSSIGGTLLRGSS